MAIDFPNSPSTSDIHTVSGKQWQWDGEKWTAYGVSLNPGVLKVDSGNSRVGINQTTPTVALDVTGSARITGDLTVSGTTVTVDAASILAKDRIVFEGATADSYETTLLVTDPTADRTLTLPDSTGTLALTGGASTAITVADTTDTTCFVGLFESATGDLGPKSDAGITYNAGTGTLTATALAGPLTGNASTATALATARTIGGTSFDGTAAIVPGTITVADTTDTSCNVALFESATGDLAPKSDAGLTYNAGTGTLTATAFAGPLTGNVTGNASGTALTVTQAAQTAITSVGTLSALAVTGAVTAGSVVAPLAFNTQTAHYTLVLADAGKSVLMNVGSGNNLTIPPNSSVAFDVGTQIVVTQIGSGTTTIVDGSGVTTNSKDNNAALDGQFTSVSLIKTATDTWLVTGALA